MKTWLLIGGLLWSPMTDQPNESERIEKAKPPLVRQLAGEFSDGWLAVAKANADAQLYGGPNCARERTELAPMERELCGTTESRRKEIQKILRKADKALTKGTLTQEEWVSAFPDIVFRKLRSGLHAMDERMRWEAMLAMVRLCDSPDHSTAAIRDACPVELEKTALAVLRNEDRAFLRHFALELLAAGNARSKDGIPTLERVRRQAPPRADRGCISILSHLNGGELEAITKGYDGQLFHCEGDLAGQALAHLNL